MRDETKTIAELEAEFASLAVQWAQVHDRRVFLQKLIAKRKADAAAQAKVSRLSDLQREALKRALDTEKR
jgi:hypothetical protein